MSHCDTKYLLIMFASNGLIIDWNDHKVNNTRPGLGDQFPKTNETKLDRNANFYKCQAPGPCLDQPGP